MPADANRVTTPAGTATFADLAAATGRRLAPWAGVTSAHRTMIVVDGPEEAAGTLAHGHAEGLDFGILPRAGLTEPAAQRLAEAGVAVVDPARPPTAVADAAPRKPGRVTVMTSGTTGLPKLVEHDWTTLNTLARVREAPVRTWFVPYQPGSYAWYQMACLGLFVPGQHLHMADPDDLVASFEAALNAGVTAVSSTPTFWRYALMSLSPDVLRSARLEAISLGGEIVDQAILDQLRALFPAAGIRHIFASSEAGAAIVVSDGRAGFPASLLAARDGAVAVKVEDDRLFVRSAWTTSAAAGGAADWVDTGDLVAVEGDRVHFRGRASTTMINVGGMKALPSEIEAALLAHPDVRWARVRARRAPLVGHLPAASVVLARPGSDPAETEAALAGFLRERLPAHAVPRFWEFLDDIPLSRSLKS